MGKKKQKSRKVKRRTKPGIEVVLLEGERDKLWRFIIERPRTVKNIRTELLFDIMFNSAVRRGEVCKLRLQDTPDYLGGNLIHVRMGKRSKDRNIPIPSRLVEKIRKYIANTRPKTLPKHIRKADPQGWLFYSKLRKQYKPNGLYELVVSTGRQAGVLKRVRPHVLRHTFSATSMDTLNIVRLKELLGHSSIKTTEIYTHIISGHRFDLAEKTDLFPDDNTGKKPPVSLDKIQSLLERLLEHFEK